MWRGLVWIHLGLGHPVVAHFNRLRDRCGIMIIITTFFKIIVIKLCTFSSDDREVIYICGGVARRCGSVKATPNVVF